MPIFIAAFFTIAKWKTEPMCPTINEWMKKMRYIYTMQYYSFIKKSEIIPFAEK
jgi:hypothetical protein